MYFSLGHILNPVSLRKFTFIYDLAKQRPKDPYIQPTRSKPNKKIQTKRTARKQNHPKTHKPKTFKTQNTKPITAETSASKNTTPSFRDESSEDVHRSHHHPPPTSHFPGGIRLLVKTGDTSSTTTTCWLARRKTSRSRGSSLTLQAFLGRLSEAVDFRFEGFEGCFFGSIEVCIAMSGVDHEINVIKFVVVSIFVICLKINLENLVSGAN